MRFAQPLKKYRRYITDDLRPFYADDEIAVLGVNTARSLTIKGGRINKTQVAWLRQKLCGFDSNVVKVVVTHHPFDLPEGHDERDVVGRSRMAMRELSACGADLFLSGHLHISHTGDMAKRYRFGGRSSLVVQAGTAASNRGRGEVNSFNVIRIASPDVAIERLIWQADQATFVVSVTDRFRRSASGWSRL
jgi:3',5'-cyclic AMP phosphodiesterase CpdA